MLINFCDSAFAIGESQTHTGLRYLKQIKQRSSTEHYGMGNVCLCSISKPYNFLKFDFTGPAHEADHLLAHQEQYRKHRNDKITALHAEGKTLREIANELGVGASTVLRVLNGRKE
jgi:IS30 family transposase